MLNEKEKREVMGGGHFNHCKVKESKGEQRGGVIYYS